MRHRTRERDRRAFGVAASSQGVDARAARIAEAEQLGGLVERLAGRVVARVAPSSRMSRRGEAHVDAVKRGVPARHQEPDERQRRRRRDVAVTTQIDSEQVPDEVIDADQRFAARPGEAFREPEADEERAREAGPRGHGDAVDVAEPDAGAGERFADDGGDRSDVIARGDLRDDAAVRRMELDLTLDDVAKDHAPSPVTTAAAVSSHARLDAEDVHSRTRSLRAGEREREQAVNLRLCPALPAE